MTILCNTKEHRSRIDVQYLNGVCVEEEREEFIKSDENPFIDLSSIRNCRRACLCTRVFFAFIRETVCKKEGIDDGDRGWARELYTIGNSAGPGSREMYVLYVEKD